jgi:uncharacterized protein YcbX
MTTARELGGRRPSGAAAGAAAASPLGRVAALAITPVKGLRIARRDELVLERGGVPDNRRFYLIDERARMVNGKRLGILNAVLADYDGAAEHLSMTFPDGTRAAGAVRLLDEEIETRFFSRTPTARPVVGPWSDALSRFTGQRLRLVQAAGGTGAVDRGAGGAVTVISRASLARLAQVADGPAIDARRFRMLIEVDGPGAHEEDEWVGRSVRIGSALVAMHGHVGRCLVTTHCPDTGVSDLPTLELLKYRRGLATSEPLAFGVYGEVLEPGRVRLGDSVTLA